MFVLFFFFKIFLIFWSLVCGFCLCLYRYPNFSDIDFFYSFLLLLLLLLQRVTPWNLGKLREAIINGSDIHPGATHYSDKLTTMRLPLNQKMRIAISRKLPSSKGALVQSGKSLDNELEGKIVYRHLQDGDVVLVNRQVLDMQIVFEPMLKSLTLLSFFTSNIRNRELAFSYMCKATNWIHLVT